MRVLLINPCLTEEIRFKSVSPPLGILYLAAMLRKHGHHVAVVDCDQEINGLLAIQQQLYDFKPDYIGITVLTSTFIYAISIARFIKSLNFSGKIVFGGMHATVFPEKILRNYNVVDYVIMGEGEYTLLELIEETLPIEDIKGLAYVKNGILKVNEKRPVLEDLDVIPFPSRDLVAKYDYTFKIDIITLKKLFNSNTKTSFATILTSRGCCYKCNYCANSAFQSGTIRFRSAANVIAEIEELARQGYTKIFFVDDHFTSNVARAIEICNGIIELRKTYNIRWFCFGRGDVVSEELYKILSAAGCMQILIGLESGSPKILDYFNKKIDLAKVRISVGLARKYGIDVVASLILGSPGETMEDIKITSDFVNSIDVDTLEVNKLTIMPGTAIWNEFLGKKMFDQDIAWTKINFIYDVDPGTTKDSLIQRARYIKRKFYLRPNYIFKQYFRKIKRFIKMA